MDFIPDLPNAREYNQCCVVVDRFTKMVYFMGLKNRKAQEVAEIFMCEIWRLYGLPKRIVSERDTVFMSSFWQEVMQLSEVALHKLSAYHP